MKLVRKPKNFWIYSEFSRHWKEASGMLHTRAIIRRPSPQISRALIVLNKKRIRAAIGTISGYWFTRNHMDTLGNADVSLCQCCRLVEETSLYLIPDCPELKGLRLWSMENPTDSGSILRNVNSDRLLRFVREFGDRPARDQVFSSSDRPQQWPSG